MPVYPPGYYAGLSLILWGITITLFFTAFVLFLRKGLSFDLKSMKMIYSAYGFVCLMLGFTRIFFIIAVYIPDNYDFYTTLGYITGIAGMIFLLYVVETYLVKKTKDIFTFVCLIAFVISILALFGLFGISRDFALNIQYILLPVALVVILLMYIYIIVKTTGTVRTKAKWLLVGMIFIAISQVMDGESFITALPWFPFEIAPSIMMVLFSLLSWFSSFQTGLANGRIFGAMSFSSFSNSALSTSFAPTPRRMAL